MTEITSDRTRLVDDLRFFAETADRHGTPWHQGCAKIMREAAALLSQGEATAEAQRCDVPPAGWTGQARAVWNALQDNGLSLGEADAITSLLAPVLEGEATAPWQDITTAPKDGTVIDVWCVTDDHAAAQFYFGETLCVVNDQWQGRVGEVYWRNGAWRTVGVLQRQSLTVTPTHWMALPTAPTDRKERQC